MSQQLSCYDMCKIVTRLEQNGDLITAIRISDKISIMSLLTVAEIGALLAASKAASDLDPPITWLKILLFDTWMAKQVKAQPMTGVHKEIEGINYKESYQPRIFRFSSLKWFFFLSHLHCILMLNFLQETCQVALDGLRRTPCFDGLCPNCADTMQVHQSFQPITCCTAWWNIV